LIIGELVPIIGGGPVLGGEMQASASERNARGAILESQSLTDRTFVPNNKLKGGKPHTEADVQGGGKIRRGSEKKKESNFVLGKGGG